MSRLVLRNFMTISKKSNISIKIKPILSANAITFVDKERSEEAKYIHKQEELHLAELKAQLEKALASDKSDATKTELLGVIESSKTEQQKSFIEKYNLASPLTAIPLGAMVLTPIFHNNIFVVNEEFYVLIAFGIFFSTVINNFGPSIAKEFDSKISDIKTSFTKVDDAVKSKLTAEVALSESVIGTDKLVNDVHNLLDDLSVLQANSLTNELEYKYRDIISKKLDSLVALENAAIAALKNRAVTEVKAKVLKTFKEDKKVKEAVLTQAMAVLTAGKDAKLGKDIVGEVFISSLKEYRENYAKQAPGSDKIITDLELNIAAVLQPPVLEEKGGNVYDTNPILQKYI